MIVSSSWIVAGSVRRVGHRRRKCGRPPGSRDTKPRKVMALSPQAEAMLAAVRAARGPLPRKELAIKLGVDTNVADVLVRRGLVATSFAVRPRGAVGKGGGRVLMLSAH